MHKIEFDLKPLNAEEFKFEIFLLFVLSIYVHTYYYCIFSIMTEIFSTL